MPSGVWVLLTIARKMLDRRRFGEQAREVTVEDPGGSIESAVAGGHCTASTPGSAFSCCRRCAALTFSLGSVFEILAEILASIPALKTFHANSFLFSRREILPRRRYP